MRMQSSDIQHAVVAKLRHYRDRGRPARLVWAALNVEFQGDKAREALAAGGTPAVPVIILCVLVSSFLLFAA